jgi:hypothetical protein
LANVAVKLLANDVRHGDLWVQKWRELDGGSVFRVSDENAAELAVGDEMSPDGRRREALFSRQSAGSTREKSGTKPGPAL